MTPEINTTNQPLFSEKKISSLFLQGSIKRLLKLSSQNGFFESKDKFGYNPLLLACKHGYTELVEHFIKLGVDINYSNYNGDTALHIATNSSRTSTIEILLKNGANPFVKNNEGQLPFHKNARIDSYIIKLFMEHGVNINSQDQHGNTLLHFACMYKNIEFMDENVEFLVANNANINIQNINGDTPLHIMVFENDCDDDCDANYAELVNIFISQNFNINLVNNDNLTVLDIAINNNLTVIIHLLQTYQQYKELSQSTSSLNKNISHKKPKL